MAPPRNGTTAETPMRQSCDRCHSQKLRCPRGNANSGACDRCLRKGARCVYSFSLPKGRPSVYNITDKPESSATRSRAGATTPSDRPAKALVTPVLIPVEPQDESADIYADFGAGLGQNAAGCTHPSAESDSSFEQPTEQDIDVFADARQPLGGLAWDGTQLHGSWSNTAHNQSPHTIIDPSQMMDTASHLASNPALPDWGGPFDNGASNYTTARRAVHSLPDIQVHQHFGRAGVRRHNSLNNGNANDGDDASKIIILQLSQLMTRFSRLQRLSYDLASTMDSSYQTNDWNKVHEKSLVDDTTFQSVSEWLVSDPDDLNQTIPKQIQYSRFTRSSDEGTTSNVLCRLFSASHDLLDALGRLRTHIRTNPTVLSVTPDSTPPAIGCIEATCSKLDAGSPPYSYPPGDHPNCVIRHMAVACYTMLLNIYVSVLNTLEYDAHARRHMNGAALGDIRLASVVQLCIYLADRQYKAMDSYLSVQDSTQALWREILISGCDPASAAAEEDMRNLKVEVEQRLARLQQVLH